MSTSSRPIKERISKWLCSCLSSKKKEDPPVALPVPRRQHRETRPASAHPNRQPERNFSVAEHAIASRRPSNQRQPEEKEKETIPLLNIQSGKTKETVKVN